MINFAISNKEELIRSNFDNSITLHSNWKMYFDKSVEVYENDKRIILFSGILWEDSVEQVFDDLNNHKPNGQFYCVLYHKENKSFEIISDFIEDFPIYVYKNIDQLMISNNLMSFSSNFTLNNDWFDKARAGMYLDKLITHIDSVPKLWSNNEFSDNTWYKNETPIAMVDRLGPGKILKIDCNNLTSTQNWFDPKADYYDLFFKEARYGYDQAKEISYRVLKNNVKKIYEKYDSVSAFASNGVDSLLLLSLIEGHLDKTKVFGYIGDWYKRENPEKIKNLYKDLPNATLQIFNIDEYLNSYNQSYTTPTRSVDLAPEVYIQKKFNIESKVIIKSSFGDEVFWHEPVGAMAAAIHKFGCDTLDKALEFCSKHYSYQPYHASNTDFDAIKNSDFKNSIMYYHYHRQFSYLKDDRPLSNRMIVSPYIDIRLRQLLVQSDEETQMKNILDASIQRDLLSERFKKYLNEHKAGGEESLAIVDYHKLRLKCLSDFIHKFIN